MVRAALGVAVDLARLFAADAIEFTSQRVVGWLRVDGDAGPPVRPEEDLLDSLTDQQLSAFLAERQSMIAPARKSRPHHEDEPPNEPPVGSLEWRARQARPSRPG